MGELKPSGNLIVAGQMFQSDAPIVSFRDAPGWDATIESCIPVPGYDAQPPCVAGRPYGGQNPTTKRVLVRPPLRRYGTNPPLDAARAVIRKVVIHHDGCRESAMAFAVNHNERGLSSHFYIDNDGTIIQSCDVALMALHAAEFNLDSISVVMCNRGDALKEPSYYAARGIARATLTCRINTNTILAFDYTPEQKDSLVRLLRALLRVLPAIPPEYPSRGGQPLWETLPRDDAFAFAGILGHYHLTAAKWDPGPLDFERICAPLRGTLCFPIAGRDQPAPVALDATTLDAEAKALYDNCEVRNTGGFFPIGPWGTSKLWHGGVHLAARDGAPVVAPFPGRIVAARMRPAGELGSACFVLLRHELAVAGRPACFFTLAMHLRDERATGIVPWIARSRALAKVASGDVGLFDDRVEAGEVIGHVGIAGPAGASRAQVHVEVFSAVELFPGSPDWTPIDGSASGRTCTAPQILAQLGDGPLAGAFARGAGSTFRRLVPYHVSEWCAEPSWSRALYGHPALDEPDIDALVAAQITPVLWWDERVAAHCRLPSDGVVYHYHPIAFIHAYHQRLASDAAAARRDPSAARPVPPGMTDFADPPQPAADDCDDKIGFHELATGQPPSCPPPPRPAEPPPRAEPPPAPAGAQRRGGLIDL